MGPELLARALRSQLVYVSMRRIARGWYEIELQPLNEPGEKLASGAAHRAICARAGEGHPR